MSLPPRCKTLSLSALMLVAFLAGSTVRAEPPPIRPDPAKTPGDVLTTDTKKICVPGHARIQREVPQVLKQQVYRSYGVTSSSSGEYEIDNLISLELGGSNAIQNLWPQSLVTQPLNVHVKDRLEKKLHDLVCSGKVPLRQAQHDIATDWIAAYEKYAGPLPKGAPVADAEKASTADEPPGFSPRRVQSASGNESTPPPVVRSSVNASEPAYPPVQPDEAGNCPASAPIKGAMNGIYHAPGGPKYGRIKARNCFATPEAAQAAGFRAPRH